MELSIGCTKKSLNVETVFVGLQMVNILHFGSWILLENRCFIWLIMLVCHAILISVVLKMTKIFFPKRLERIQDIRQYFPINILELVVPMPLLKLA